MDPVTGFGLAANILAFIDVGVKSLREAKKIYKSPSGLGEETKSLEKAAKEMHDFSDKLQVKGPRSLADSEQDLCDLANKCDIAAGKILTLIERIRPEDTPSILQTYVSIWKRAFYREDLLALEARLASYRSRIQLQLIDLTRSVDPSRDMRFNITDFFEHLSQQTITELKLLVRDARDNSARLQEIESVIEKLRAGVNLCSLSDSVKENVEKLVRVSEIRLEHLAQVSILRGLRFDTMYHRYDMVCEAHKRTFRWILSDKLDERCNADCPNRQQKESSLSSKKAPAICTVDRGGKPPHMAGDVAFRSEQNPASQCLSACKERRGIRHQLTQWLSSGSGVFHFSAKLGAGKSTLMKMIASDHETQKLLKTWAGDKTLICAKFFFWNSGSEQQKSVSGLYLGLLHELVCPQFGNVKICVASRPLNAFSEMAPPQQTICLHNLTKRDMALYISDKLQGIEDDDILASISKAIVEKAQVIFFWTALVAKDIREQIANGNDPENLIQQINQLPEEINDLFAHIPHSLTPRDQRRAYQVLAVLLRAQTDNRSDLMTITVWGAAMIEESQGIPYPELFSAFSHQEDGRYSSEKEDDLQLIKELQRSWRRNKVV
ncbi:hypothetical protein CSAL01_10345 [Colletotrichum salicis]|uniref:Nephrocystin 3-like N-terminal domain-containing protein n=1 Tax=Colletotrichum salicis TaxID=1209931 RepID=A0A135UN79_9PEZI|nr:hypothetical protein CSAL01_10345 [Colletotrichum salicis]